MSHLEADGKQALTRPVQLNQQLILSCLPRLLVLLDPDFRSVIGAAFPTLPQFPLSILIITVLDVLLKRQFPHPKAEAMGTRAMDFDGVSFCFHFSRWCCYGQAEFYSLNGTSIMESVVLRSRGLLRSGAVHGESILSFHPYEFWDLNAGWLNSAFNR